MLSSSAPPPEPSLRGAITAYGGSRWCWWGAAAAAVGASDGVKACGIGSDGGMDRRGTTPSIGSCCCCFCWPESASDAANGAESGGAGDRGIARMPALPPTERLRGAMCEEVSWQALGEQGD